MQAVVVWTFLEGAFKTPCLELERQEHGPLPDEKERAMGADD